MILLLELNSLNMMEQIHLVLLLLSINSSEINVFFEHMISAVCSGESIDNILKELEKLRLEALEDKK